jgi:hypothetical protein
LIHHRIAVLEERVAVLEKQVALVEAQLVESTRPGERVT